MPSSAEFSQLWDWQLVCAVWQSLSKLWWMLGEITPEKPNFTPHKTVHQAANCYSECILLHLPWQAEAISQTPLHKLKVWCHPVNVKLFRPAQASAGIYSTQLLLNPSTLHWLWTEAANAALLVSPSPILSLSVSVFTRPSLFSPACTSQWCFPLLHSHSISLLLSLHPFHFRLPLFYLTPLFPPDDAFTQVHTSSPSFFHSILLSFPSLPLILQPFFFSVFNHRPQP